MHLKSSMKQSNSSMRHQSIRVPTFDVSKQASEISKLKPEKRLGDNLLMERNSSVMTHNIQPELLSPSVRKKHRR